jgi:hypothetical protein
MIVHDLNGNSNAMIKQFRLRLVLTETLTAVPVASPALTVDPQTSSR